MNTKNFNINNFIKKIKTPNNVQPFGDVTFSFSQGNFYLDCNSNFRQIIIQYSGRITLHPNFNFPDNLQVSMGLNSNTIIIINKEFERPMENNILFRYIGTLQGIPSVRLYSYNNHKIKATCVNNGEVLNFSKNDTLISNSDELFDLTPIPKSRKNAIRRKRVATPLNYDYSTILPGEEMPSIPDNIAFRTRYIEQLYRNKSNIKSAKNFSSLKSRLPDKYRPAEDKNVFCGNCAFLKKNTYCKLWEAPVRRIFVCNNWERRK